MLGEEFVASIKAPAQPWRADDLARHRRRAARSVDGRKLRMFCLRLAAGKNVAEGERTDTLPPPCSRQPVQQNLVRRGLWRGTLQAVRLFFLPRLRWFLAHEQ